LVLFLATLVEVLIFNFEAIGQALLEIPRPQHLVAICLVPREIRPLTLRKSSKLKKNLHFIRLVDVYKRVKFEKIWINGFQDIALSRERDAEKEEPARTKNNVYQEWGETYCFWLVRVPPSPPPPRPVSLLNAIS
jgi:hypothetical protein